MKILNYCLRGWKMDFEEIGEMLKIKKIEIILSKMKIILRIG